MITKIKNWIKRFKKWLFALFVIPSAFAGGLDAVQLNDTPIQTKDVIVASEQVHLEQKGNVVEASMPWKGERGLKVKYDYGEPSLKEKIVDKRSKEVVAEKVSFSQGEGFKVDILLKEKPETNTFCYFLEGWENYDFFYQPPLTQAEIDEGAHRPEEIVGSYAVYHKTLKNHILGQTNYETGKFGHIPFPYIWEVGKEDKKIRAENLTYNAGKLCVVVPQSFLDKADYTNGVRIDPTFGYTTAGASFGNGSGKTTYTKAVAASAGNLTKLSVYIVWNFSGTGNFVTGVYSDSSGANSKLATAATITIANAAPAWYDGAITLATTATTYHLAEYDSGSANYRWYYDTGTNGDSDKDTSFTSLPATASLSGLLINRLWSIYATYTESSASPTAPAFINFE